MTARARSMTTRSLLIATVLISAIVGAVTGFSTSYLVVGMRPAAQNRDFYLFARDLSFNFSLTSGSNALTSDYIYSSNYIFANKGDTIIIHFYNPTDEHHSFTMDAPYAQNVTLAAGPTDTDPNLPIHDATITITVTQSGSFLFHCIFHSPQMRGVLVVTG